ncbi:unnamed protein product [Thlaspi arvense]|uniref:Uncharacterized protein n=1 Tax=Thlaspi arvense TaxID=13288 RepID=A0AAU9TB39_THLAR|nr:unnamed protein product [Thlaspi arvense]
MGRRAHESTPSRRFSITPAPFTNTGDLLLRVTAILQASYSPLIVLGVHSHCPRVGAASFILSIGCCHVGPMFAISVLQASYSPLIVLGVHSHCPRVGAASFILSIGCCHVGSMFAISVLQLTSVEL